MVWIRTRVFLTNPMIGYPIGFTKDGKARPQGPYYCGVGIGNSNGREVVLKHLHYCIKAGLTISGIKCRSSSWSMGISNWTCRWY